MFLSIFILLTNPVNATDDCSEGIAIRFYDNVTNEDAKDLINSYNLDGTFILPNIFTFYLTTSTGSLIDYVDELKESDIVVDAYCYPKLEKINPKYLIVQFNMTTKNETAYELINSFDGLEIDLVSRLSKVAFVNLPDGDEQKWVETFQDKEIVDYVDIRKVSCSDDIKPNEDYEEDIKK